MAKTVFTEHPDFVKASKVANDVLSLALVGMGLEKNALDDFEVSANRIADDLTRTLLRAVDLRAKRRAA